MCKLLVSVAISLVLAPGLQGAVILSDTFSYTNGVLQSVSANKWIGHSGPTNQVDVSNGTLRLSQSEGQDVNASFAGQSYGTANGDRLYASFRVKFTGPPSGAGSYFAHFKDAAAGFRTRIWALTNSAAPGALRLGISSTSGSEPATIHTTDLQLNSEYVVVTRLILTNGISSLWIDPYSESAPSISTGAGGVIPISSFAFRQASGIGSIQVDDLLIGTTFDDVVPPAEQTNTWPAIRIQPQSMHVVAGKDVTFSVEAAGAEPLSYQWTFNELKMAGATNPLVKLASVTAREQGEYRVIISNSAGTAMSQAAALTVVSLDAPVIATQPAHHTLKVGDNVTFTVLANGTEPLTYQWRFGSQEIKGANSAALTLTKVTPDQAGAYGVTVRNSVGMALSEMAMLTVKPVSLPPVTNVIAPKPPVIKLTNLLENLVRPGDLPTNTFSELVLRPGEQLTTTVYASQSESGELRLSMNVDALPPFAAWTVHENSTANIAFAPTPAEAGTNYVFEVQAINAGGTNRMAWSVYVPTALEQQLVLAEFLANPATASTAPHFNPLRRAEAPPSPSSSDEYVEVVNLSDQDIDLLDWTISDSAQVRHRFNESFPLEAKQAILIYGGPLTGFLPVLDALAIPASESTFGFGLNNNGGDSILIRNASSNLVSRTVYMELSSNSSLTRYPDFNGEFVAHSTIATNAFSPGRRFDGRPYKETVAPARPAFTVSVAREASESLVLRWTAEPGKTYTVLRSSSLGGLFVPMAMDLTFADEHGQYVDRHWSSRPISFYRLSSP